MSHLNTDPARLVFGLVISLALHGVLVRAVILGRQSTRWPTTAGVLDWFAVQHGKQGVGLRVHYRYRVDGVEYIGNRYRIGEFPYGGSVYPRETPLDAWRVGMPLTVHYHPQRPHLATLETGVQPMTQVFFVSSILIFVTCGAALLVTLIVRV